MSPPTVLVCASDADATTAVIRGILKDEASSPEVNEVEAPDIMWSIDNKYYHAQVCLRGHTDAQSINHINMDSVEAVIIYIRNDKGESLATAQKRMQALGDVGSEVNILLCDKCNETLPREQAAVWCLEHQYQLIELDEEPDPFFQDCLIKDYYGMDRVIQTLHTHTWSNRDHKGECHIIQDDDDDDDLDQFCKLFGQMSSVTQNAASMTSEGRKAYAEQVVVAFWNAIDGDESELDDDEVNL